jgi:putative MATE family efflux protein
MVNALTASTPRIQLTEGPIARTLLWFALPILGGTLLQSLSASINAVWIGHFLGESALAATSNATLILFLLLNAVFGVSIAATILVGQALGASRVDEAKRVVGTGVGFITVISFAVAIVGYLTTPTLLRWLSTPIDAMEDAATYLRIIFIALPPMYFYAFLMMALRGAGDSKTPFLFMGLSVVLDACLNPLFIFGIGPFPRLGIAGAATATLVAETAALIALLATLRLRRHFLWLGPHELALLRPDWAILRALTVKGLPMGLQMVMYSIAALSMMKLVNSHGSQTVAAYGAALQLWTYVLMPAQAIGAAVSSMVAQNVGAKKWCRVAPIANVGIAYNFLFGGALIGLLYVGNRDAVGLFLPSDVSATNLAEHLNGIVIWSLVFFGINFVLFGAVRAAGAVWPPVLILLVALWFVRPGFAVLLQPAMGVDAIWWSFPVSYLLATALTMTYYHLGRWREARMIERFSDSGVAIEGEG